MKKIIFIFMFVFTICFADQTFAQVPDPQYIFMRKDSTCSNCYNWSGNDPSQIDLPAISEIFGKLGTKGTNTRKIGVGVLFSYNQTPISNLQTSLSRLLNYSLVHDFPVFIVLDGFEWWDSRPDLYNNPNNVEWTCWDASCAIKKSWRNWGSEFELKPHPNIASPVFIAANQASLTQLVPIITTWYNNLPPEKKYLLGGVSTTMEQDIGANYYYYPSGIKNASGLPGTIQLGYAAVKTAGIKSSGIITSTDLNQVIRHYQEALNKTVFDLGIPRNKLFNHNGGQGLAPFMEYPAGVAFAKLDASLNSFSNPGWSFYGDVTVNPQKYPDLINTLNQINNGEWASPEWLSWATDYNGWTTALRNSLNYHNNRFINVANWEAIRSQPYAIQAIRDVANESPTCWVTKPYMNSVTIGTNSATFNWQKGVSNDAVYLLVSSVGEFNNAGVLTSGYLVNEAVTARTSYPLYNLNPGTYYWELVTDGCNNTQRKISDGRFVIAAPPTSIPPTTIPTQPPLPTYVKPQPTAIPTKIKISGDYDDNNLVNLADFGEWKKRYLATPPTATLADFGVWKKAYLGN